MTIQNLFDTVKAGKYTADACAEAAQEPQKTELTRDTKLRLSQIKRDETTDKKYEIGETSPVTGKTKVAEGKWVLKGEGKAAAENNETKEDNTTGKDFKEGQKIPNAGAQAKNYRHKQNQYLAAYDKESDAHPKEVTELRDTLASLVANSRGQAEMFETLSDMEDWNINEHVAETLNDYKKEEDKLLGKLKELETPATENNETKEDNSLTVKANEIIKAGAKAKDYTKGPGLFVGKGAQRKMVEREFKKRLANTDSDLEEFMEGMDDEAIKNAYNGIMAKYYDEDK